MLADVHLDPGLHLDAEVGHLAVGHVVALDGRLGVLLVVGHLRVVPERRVRDPVHADGHGRADDRDGQDEVPDHQLAAPQVDGLPAELRGRVVLGVGHVGAVFEQRVAGVDLHPDGGTGPPAAELHVQVAQDAEADGGAQVEGAALLQALPGVVVHHLVEAGVQQVGAVVAQAGGPADEAQVDAAEDLEPVAGPAPAPVVPVQPRVLVGEVLPLGDTELLPLPHQPLGLPDLVHVLLGDLLLVRPRRLLGPLDVGLVSVDVHPGDQPPLLLGARLLHRPTPGLLLLDGVAIGGQQQLALQPVQRQLDGAGQQLLFARRQVQGVGELLVGLADVEHRHDDPVAALRHHRDPAAHHPVHAGDLTDHELAAELVAGRAALVVEDRVHVLHLGALAQADDREVLHVGQRAEQEALEQNTDACGLGRLAGHRHDQHGLGQVGRVDVLRNQGADPPAVVLERVEVRVVGQVVVHVTLGGGGLRPPKQRDDEGHDRERSSHRADSTRIRLEACRAGRPRRATAC